MWVWLRQTADKSRGSRVRCARKSFAENSVVESVCIQEERNQKGKKIDSKIKASRKEWELLRCSSPSTTTVRAVCKEIEFEFKATLEMRRNDRINYGAFVELVNTRWLQRNWINFGVKHPLAGAPQPNIYPAATTDNKKNGDSHASSETFSDKFFEVSPHNGLVENWIINFSLAQAISSDNAINMPFVFRSFFARLAFPFKSPTTRRKTLPLVLCSLCFRRVDWKESSTELHCGGGKKSIVVGRRMREEKKKLSHHLSKPLVAYFSSRMKNWKPLLSIDIKLVWETWSFPIHPFGWKGRNSKPSMLESRRTNMIYLLVLDIIFTM